MSTEANKALVHRMFEEVYNQGHYEVADEVFTENYVSHNGLGLTVLGPEGIKRIAAMQRAAFPDLHSSLEDLIAEGDKVVVRGVDRLTHTGEFLGYPPTGKTFFITWIDIFRIENGKLAEAWLEIDMENFRKLLSGEV
jgi:predicted ester cyclase